MAPLTSKQALGGVGRRCGCADPVTGRQLGGNCPGLADEDHGSWYIQLELPAGLDGSRRRIRRRRWGRYQVRTEPTAPACRCR
jgi:hypothetical protein